MTFKNYLQISKIKKNETAQNLEQNNIKVVLDAPWNLVKLDRMLNFFIYSYKLLKVPLFFYYTWYKLHKSKKAKYSIKARSANDSK